MTAQTFDPGHIYMSRGKWFQIPMILVWGLLPVYAYKFDSSKIFTFDLKFEWSTLIEFVGLGIMLASMFQIYRGKDNRRLVTTNLFALTRHPMYHGMFIAALSTMFHADLRDPVYWCIYFVFTVLILIAGWFQEQETLARWDREAIAYYARTPRFIWQWLWRMWR